MSWFSRSFSMKEEEERRTRPERRDGDDNGEDDEEEEEEESEVLNLAEIASATGASVKEDFSALKKTFTRQLWGVASFLAPPPPEKSASAAERGGGGGGGGVTEEEEKGSPQEQWAGQQQGNDGKAGGSSGAASETESLRGQEGFGVESPALVLFNMSSPGGGSVGGVLPSEDSDPQLTGSPRNDSNVSGESNDAVRGSNRGPTRPKLTGLRSDFAELRGTVATGISRITSVLREVARDDDSGREDEDEGEEEGHLPLVSSREDPHSHPSLASGEQQDVSSPRRGFDAFLKPLFGSMLMRERSSGEASIEGDEYPARDEGTERGASSRESPSKGEPKYKQLERLPLAISSGIGGISKLAANLLQMVGDEDDEEKEDDFEEQDLPVGLTEPVVTFARNIATHPETWLDFPLAQDDADDDFELTNAQEEHIRALEVVAPRLGALKIEVCPNYMTEGRFWKIYFVLMHSRLSSNEALMLSNQQVVRARASMLQELQTRDLQVDEFEFHQEDLLPEKVENDDVELSQQTGKQAEEGAGRSRLSTPLANTSSVSSSFEDKRDATEVGGRVEQSMSSSTEETGLTKAEPDAGRISMLHLEDVAEVDEWPDEEPSTTQHETGDPPSLSATSNLDDEDVSFSDLEEDDSSDKAPFTNEETSPSSVPESPPSIVLDSAPANPLVGKGTSSSPSTQGDGTPRKSSERGEFNDWFKVDQDDVASAGSSSP